MEPTSAKWDEAQKQRMITAPSILELSIEVTDPDAQADSTSTSNGEESFSHASKLLDGQIKSADRYATLENNIWVLDGSCSILSDSDPYPDNGFISGALSEEDGTFSEPPVITITFPKVFTTYLEGITVTWGAAYSGEYADTFTVVAYNGTTEVARKTVSGNRDMTSVVFLSISNYDSIQLTVDKWAIGCHRARIQSLFLGIRHTYTKSDISQYSHKMSADLLSNELPSTEVSFSVKNLDLTYDPDNDTGMSKFLMARQKVDVRYGYELDGTTEKIQAAVVYLDEWESPRDGIYANFTARGLPVFLEEKYTGTSSGTLYQIAVAALTQADIPKKNDGTPYWYVDESLKNVTAPDGANLSDRSIAEVLQFAANAACCVMWQDRHGVLRIAPYTSIATEYSISTFNEYGYPETALDKPLKAVKLNDGQYILEVANQGVVQEISNPLVNDSQAPAVCAWVRDILLYRQTLTGSWRADPKIEVLDAVAIDTPFSTNNAVLTSIELTFNGAWRGNYEARVLDTSKSST